jgi:hypothetical protein
LLRSWWHSRHLLGLSGILPGRTAGNYYKKGKDRKQNNVAFISDVISKVFHVEIFNVDINCL